MPAITSGLVLVSGANGYLGVWLVDTLLRKGYSVRGVVRSADKGEHLSKLFASYGSKFELCIVKDITADGAFDEAVKGVDGVAHTASPYHVTADEPSEIIDPAVKGTTSILKSAQKNGSSIKRIVVTSSTTAVNDLPSKPTKFTAEDWNDKSVEEVIGTAGKPGKGRNATGMYKYKASKTLAERAAEEVEKEIQGENKYNVGWDLVRLAPPYVYGPVLHEVDRPEQLNTSVKDWYNLVMKGIKSGDPTDIRPFTLEELASLGNAWVDVRDLAEEHVAALEKPAAGGERILLATGEFKYQDWINAANEVGKSIYPDLPKGNTSYKKSDAVHLVSYDTEKKDRILQIKARTMEETTKDTLEDFKKRGW